MNIRSYLETNKISQSAFARTVGVKQPTVHKWVHGLSLPDVRHARVIVAETKGTVTLDDMYMQDLAS
jgi:DNA-binding transcriptional regulator YiaG